MKLVAICYHDVIIPSITMITHFIDAEIQVEIEITTSSLPLT